MISGAAGKDLKNLWISRGLKTPTSPSTHLKTGESKAVRVKSRSGWTVGESLLPSAPLCSPPPPRGGAGDEMGDGEGTPLLLLKLHSVTRGSPAGTGPRWLFCLLRALNWTQRHRKCEQKSQKKTPRKDTDKGVELDKELGAVQCCGS